MPDRRCILPIVACLVLGAVRAPGPPRAAAPRDEDGWPAAMARVHARFRGQPGTFAHFGDSITVSLAFWSPLRQGRKNAPPAMERAYQLAEKHLRPECWQEWKGPEFGDDGGRTIRWADENVDAWLEKLDPEVALIMFGTNDLTSLEPGEYRDRLRAVVRRGLDRGTVVILSTIPPRHGFEEKAAAFAGAARQVARELAVPLVDYHAEILKRRPNDWDGAGEAFREYEGYDVPTLISRDGVHPSAPKAFPGDDSVEALRSHGYDLRNDLVLMAYAEVVEALAAPRPADGTAAGLPHRPWFPQAPPLPTPAGEVIRVADVEGLHAATRRVQPGGTILLADGVYPVTQTVAIATDRVTLRGESGRRERVVLDGGGTLGELLTLRSCSGVTVADLTIQNVRWNGIKLDSDKNVQRATIRNCVLHNIWQRAVKGVKVPEAGREVTRPHGCVVEYCLFVNDRPKQFEDDPADTPRTFDGNYIGGIDVMYPTGWTIRDNAFLGIRGRTGSARGAVFLWHDARDCIVERNVIVDCDSGVCLGNWHKPADVPTHCTGVVVRNNFLCRVPENGILADATRDCAILHNTVHDPRSRLGRLVRLVHDNDGLRVMNNLLSGPPPRIESDSKIDLRGNRSGDFTAAFVAPEEGNLRLTAAATDAIDKATALLEVATDIDRKLRGTAPDLGAHEFPGP
jgi:lysophospholipase L1-like esterase